ncbi:MAG: hypothetical protein A2Y33_08875 [Spirochaetes bacterium GWF1_51_8]|nr:MAG: hypothetical protein A2Y33_08875 [Spirochaetes bacterium GWF1_51_8]
MIRSTRVFVNIKATYTIKTSTYSCEVLDLSMEGLKIGTRQILEAGDLLKITLDLESRTIMFFCVVKNKGENSGEYGIRIEELHPEDKIVLDDFLLKFMIRSNLDLTEEFKPNP